MDNDVLGQLAVAQALYREFGRMVKTGEPDNLRGRADALLADGVVDRVKLKVNGKSVGTLSARWEHARTYLRVEDREAFADWCVGDGSAYTREWIVRGMRGSIADFCTSALVTDGEIPDGCEVVEEPERLVGTVLRGCDAEDIADALGMNLPQATVYALTGEVGR